jgi:hypothetical protein
MEKIDVVRIEPGVKIMIRGPMGGVHEISIEADDEQQCIVESLGAFGVEWSCNC